MHVMQSGFKSISPSTQPQGWQSGAHMSRQAWPSHGGLSSYLHMAWPWGGKLSDVAKDSPVCKWVGDRCEEDWIIFRGQTVMIWSLVYFLLPFQGLGFPLCLSCASIWSFFVIPWGFCLVLSLFTALVCIFLVVVALSCVGSLLRLLLMFLCFLFIFSLCVFSIPLC